MINAVILAAGSGRRLKINKPKGLLNIGSKPLIEHSINNLQLAGVGKIYIITGFAHEYYEEHFSRNPNSQVELIHNPEWANCGSLYSLHIALQSIVDEDTVILDSDILYNRNEFLDFMSHAEKNSILVTNVPDGRNDACYVEHDLGYNLLRVSKNINTISYKDGDTMWEYIGITKTSADTLPLLRKYASNLFVLTGSIDHEYDYAFEVIDATYKVIRYKDYIWSEADDNQQLHYMITNTYPKISL
jgi:choline kinase